MGKTSRTIVFFGNERLATGVSTSAPTLQRLVAAGYDVAAVVSNYEVGTSRNARKLEIQQIAEQHSIPVLLPTKPADIIDQLVDLNAAAAVLVAYGKIVPQSIIDIFPSGIINIHPSLLPQHRGPTPIESVLLDGSNKTGVSIMQLSRSMDAGPVYAQSEVTLSGNESKQALADQLLEVGGTMLVDVLPGILDGSIVALPQHDASATYDKLVSKTDGILDWSKSAEELERQVRAYAVWPQSRCILGHKDVVVTAVHVINGSTKTPGTIEYDNKSLVVHCGKNILSIDRLKPSGKSEMDIVGYIAGYGKML